MRAGRARGRAGRGQLRDRLRRPQRGVPGAGPADRRRSRPRRTRRRRGAAADDGVRQRPHRGRGDHPGDRASSARTSTCAAPPISSVEQGPGRRLPAQPGGAPASARSACWWRSSSTAEPRELAELGKQLAMHVAAANPHAGRVDRRHRCRRCVARERQIFADQARASGKPENIIEKMVEGRRPQVLRGSPCCSSRSSVIDTDKRVKQVIEAAAKELGAPVDGHRLRAHGAGRGRREAGRATSPPRSPR